MRLRLTFTEAELATHLPALWKHLRAYRVVALTGEMGAGKTTLVRALCRYLHTNTIASSPTFSLVNTYTFNENAHTYFIYHMDWYRLSRAEDLREIDLDYYYENAHAHCLIEWADKFPACLPHNTSQIIRLHLHADSAHTRTLTLSPWT